MKTIILEKVGDFKALKKQPVRVSEASNIVEGEVLVYDTDGNFMFYQRPNFITDERVAEKFFDIKYPASSRLSGIASMSEIFGYAPRDPVKKHAGRACKFNRTYGITYNILKAIGRHSSKAFEAVAPDKYQKHFEAVADVPDCWKMPGSIFTSGIINCSNRLIYHTDNGNVKNCYSAMITFRKQSKGGFLHLPEYDAIIKNPHGSLLIFDGGRIIHGVTPFDTKEGKRITIVFYALEGIKRLKESQQAEIDYFNKTLTENYAWKE